MSDGEANEEKGAEVRRENIEREYSSPTTYNILFLALLQNEIFELRTRIRCPSSPAAEVRVPSSIIGR